jgi:hypothetical protein
MKRAHRPIIAYYGKSGNLGISSHKIQIKPLGHRLSENIGGSLMKNS